MLNTLVSCANVRTPNSWAGRAAFEERGASGDVNARSGSSTPCPAHCVMSSGVFVISSNTDCGRPNRSPLVADFFDLLCAPLSSIMAITFCATTLCTIYTRTYASNQSLIYEHTCKHNALESVEILRRIHCTLHIQLRYQLHCTHVIYSMHRHIVQIKPAYMSALDRYEHSAADRSACRHRASQSPFQSPCYTQYSQST